MPQHDGVKALCSLAVACGHNQYLPMMVQVPGLWLLQLGIASSVAQSICQCYRVVHIATTHWYTNTYINGKTILKKAVLPFWYYSLV